MRCGGIEIEIQAQCELENQNDFLKYYDKVSKNITTFDFSKYENMSIEELRSYLLVWDENVSGCIVRGENLIKGKTKRACVGIYSLLKGGTYIYVNSDSEDSKNKMMEGNKLNFKLTEKNGDYGIIFKGSEPVAFAMFNKEDFSLSVAFKKGERNKCSNGDVIASVYLKTNNFYGVNDYRVIVSDNIVNAHTKRYEGLNN
jgi:hypothetical protein